MYLLRYLTRRRCFRSAVLLLASLTAGCAASLEGPPEVTEGRTVELLEHGRHSSLLLTRADATRVRYAYGDWAWYVEEDTGLTSAVRALLRDSAAGFGRQQLGPARPGVPLERDVGLGIRTVYRFQVQAERVDRLIDRLDQRFEGHEQPPRPSDARQLSFVPHPRPYRFSYNSNHMVADWLRELGVQVNGNPALGRWRLAGAGSTD